MEDYAPVSILGLREIIAILSRRRYWIIVPLVVGAIVAGTIAMTAQPVYKSSAALLIESPQVPTNLVASTFGSYGDERIAKIRQQILRRSNLVDLINRNNLYANERHTRPMDEVLSLMREAIQVELVGANAVTQSRNGVATTIAFNLSYTYGDPGAAHQVAEQLTRMFLEEDKRLRTEQASGSAAFIGRRAEDLRRRLVDLEAERRAVRSRYGGALPDQILASTQSSSALRAEISRIEAETQSIMQQNGVLAARAQEIASAPSTPAQVELARAHTELDRLTAKYSDTFPDVIAARAALARAQAAARSERERPVAALTIEAELHAGRARIAALGRRRSELLAVMSGIDRVVSLSPQAAFELSNLEREYDNLKLQYQDIRERQLEAQVSANLQAEDRGERLTVTDPPSFPYAPESPNRPALLMMGIVGGAGLGIAAILAIELLTWPIHGPGAITALTGEPPLVSIGVMDLGPAPVLLTRVDRALLRLRRFVARR